MSAETVNASPTVRFAAKRPASISGVTPSMTTRGACWLVCGRASTDVAIPSHGSGYPPPSPPRLVSWSSVVRARPADSVLASATDGLEEFDRIPGWIVGEHLFAAGALDDLAAERHTC